MCIKALPPITGAAIDLVVWQHRPMTFRPKLPTLLNGWPLVSRYPNWNLLPRGELKAMDREAQGILQIGARQPHSERSRCHRVRWLEASLCLENQPLLPTARIGDPSREKLWLRPGRQWTRSWREAEGRKSSLLPRTFRFGKKGRKSRGAGSFELC